MSVASQGSNNTYYALTDDDWGDNVPTQNQAKRIRPVKIKAPPPFVVQGKSITEIHNLIQLTNIPQQNIKKQLTQFGTKIFVSTNEEHLTLKNALDANKFDFFTFSLEEQRTTKLVLYGLPDLNLDELKNELKSFAKLEPSNITKMHIRRERYSGQCNYLLYFPKSQGIRLLQVRQQVRGILGYLVRWEYYTPRKANITQCGRCQAFGHASQNCRLQVKCLKCSKSHQSSSCPLNDPGTGRVPDESLKCVHCGGNHSARHKDCPSRIKFLQIREQVRQRNKPKNNFNFQNISTINNEFPGLQNNPNSMHRNTNHIFSTTFSETLRNANSSYVETTGNLFSKEECWKIFCNFMNAINKCKTKAEQIYTIGELIFKSLLDTNDGRP